MKIPALTLVPLLLVSAGVAFVKLRPEIAAQSPESLQKNATHIAIGTVQRVFESPEKKKAWDTTYYVAEILVDELEKGERRTPSEGGAAEPLYARWLRRKWRARSPMPAGSNGHWGWTPEAGDRVRVFLKQNDAAGWFPKGDGGYTVLFPNGYEKLE